MAVRTAGNNTSARRLRTWAHDTLEARADLTAIDLSPDDTAYVEAERRVAAATLEFLRDQPHGDGAGFRSWVATTNPFDDENGSFSGYPNIPRTWGVTLGYYFE